MQLDSVLFPVNYVNYAEGDFGPQILAEAKKRGLARMALQVLGAKPPGNQASAKRMRTAGIGPLKMLEQQKRLCGLRSQRT